MKSKFSMAMSLAVILALIAATIALADNLLTDGDGLTPVVDTTSLDLGSNICLGSTTTKPIAHAINRNGNYSSTNVFAKSTNVTVSVGTVTGSGLSASFGDNTNTIAIPLNWDMAENNTRSPAVFSNIKFVANSLGTFSGTVNYSARGTGSNGGTLTRTDSLAVTAIVINCDTNPPTLHLPDDIIEEATSATGATVSFSVSADDANPEHPAVTCDYNSGDTFPLDETTTVTCSATDAVGNTATDSFDITVVDTTPPDVSTPDNIIAEAAGPIGTVVTYSGESATDLVDGDIAVVTCEPESGSTFPLGENTVTCSATDAHDNIGSADFTIDVQDNTGPILALPADITEEATSASGAAVNFSVSASDLVDGDVDVTCDADSGDTFPLGKTLVSCSATDSNGNTNGGSFNVNVVDTTAPELDLPDSLSVEAAGPNGAIANFLTSATDLVDGFVTVVCTPASGSTFPLGETAVNCSATDSHSNTANASFNVTVVDTTAPDLTLSADEQVEATGPNGAAVIFDPIPSATDLVDGSLAVSCSANSGDTFPLGTTIVECSVSDAAGNEASGSFTIIVEDTTAPVITFVSRTSANGNGWNNGDVTVNWSCFDIVGVVSASVSQTVSSEGENQSATGICTDTSGNTASDIQSGINIDKTKPSASASRTPAANSFGWNNSDVTISFNGTDDRSGIDFCSTPQTFGEGAGKSASGTCTDKAGNVSVAAIVDNINVDKTAPTISGAPDRDANGNGWYKDDVTVTFTCGDALSGVDDCTDSVALGEGADQSVPGSVTDKAGNSANTTVSGINIDKTAPTISAALDKTTVGGWFNISTGAPTVSFTCNDALSGLDGTCPASHLFGDGENQSYNQTIYDLAGNSASAGVSDVDVDTVAPSVSVALDRSPEGSWFNANTGAPVAEFTCGDATSSVATCPADYTFPEGADLSHEGTVFDHAGNSNSASIGSVYVDLTAPTLTWDPAMIANGASFYFGFIPAYPPNPCVAADLLSGPNGCSMTGYATAVGSHTMTATAQDVAGNEYSEQRTYTVMAWTLNGFYRPVDMNGVLNTVKGGSTVPLKFEAFAGPTELTDTAVISTLLKQVTCNATVEDTIEVLATGGTSLRYDTIGGQFIFNWQTPKLPGKCYSVTMTTKDGSSITALFKLK